MCPALEFCDVSFDISFCVRDCSFFIAWSCVLVVRKYRLASLLNSIHVRNGGRWVNICSSHTPCSAMAGSAGAPFLWISLLYAHPGNCIPKAVLSSSIIAISWMIRFAQFPAQFWVPFLIHCTVYAMHRSSCLNLTCVK